MSKLVLRICSRGFSTKSRRIRKSVLLQDEEKVPIDKYRVSGPKERRVFVWGYSETGALGVHTALWKHKGYLGSYVQNPTRQSFASSHDVLDVTCGYGFSLFLTKDVKGVQVFGSGINTDCQIGFHKHGGATNRPMHLMIYPAPIELPKKSEDEKLKIVSIAAGRAHAILLSEDGEVFSMGNNAYGQLGREIIEEEDYVKSHIIHRFRVPDEHVCGVYCGQDHTMLLTKSGKVFSCGWAADGQTGSGTYETSGAIRQALGDIAGERIVKLACAADCVLALNDRGEVFGWGNTEYGQLSSAIGSVQQIHTPIKLPTLAGLGKITDVAAGGSHCLALNEHGDVFAWGYGILGFGPQADCVLTPRQIPAALFGRNDFNRSSVVTSISSGISHMGAINSDGDLFMWGVNKHGCLGLGNTKDMFFPFKTALGAKVLKISCGVDHTVALCKAFV
ncbi:RCC1-like G exchanging factor-like protein [Phlebotomus argentipes]|uniref:RCC1-like G exchanging factor-like protein n=1 Tax=Phlebotomus argentipes TaxID=94469 RepID=UPI0028937CF1|nr:RCC1-like G exchanging factor-like protein [Phlebotomus argentipes]XP_059613990.1 RCC1-like G exchanging factor-like protein [Phlebotomus argentipes]